MLLRNTFATAISHDAHWQYKWAKRATLPLVLTLVFTFYRYKVCNMIISFEQPQKECGEFTELPSTNKDADTRKTCFICLEKLVKSTQLVDGHVGYSGPGLPCQSLKCGHTYCTPCLATYLKIKLRGFSNPFPLYCPQSNCPCEVADSQIVDILSGSDYDLWKSKRAESDMRNKIYCPNKRCSILIDINAISSIDGSLTMCSSCHHAICIHCKVLWHNAYEKLEMHGESNEDSAVLYMATEENWCRCFNCKTLIELKEGSNHITCRCGTQLCYRCNGPWDSFSRQCGRHQCPLWDKEVAKNEQRCDQLNNGSSTNAILNVTINTNSSDTKIDIPTKVVETSVSTKNSVDRELQPQTTLPEPIKEQPKALKQQFQIFVSMETLNAHMDNTQQHSVYRCCGAIFPNLATMESHQVEAKCQPKNCINIRPEIKISDVRNGSTKNRRDWFYNKIILLQCCYCSVKFSSPEALETHLRTTTSHNVYYCCKRFFLDKSSIQQHRKGSTCKN
ncbi:hypothetical protein BDF19DRAFT_454526 [Syncephalis fuscata]|nr:hypothetical protein BDF19DRAFT_454526 [Syncephalis fuscata]